jgi:hypothetical protein
MELNNTDGMAFISRVGGRRPGRERSRLSAALFVDLERPVGDFDQDPAILDDHGVDRQR